MAYFVRSTSIFRKILIATACLALTACIQSPAALAQHGGGHMGGGHFGGGSHFGGGRFSGGPHVGVGAAPRVSPQRTAPAPFSRSRFSAVTPPAWGAAVGGVNFRHRPIHPRPILPVFPVPVFWGGPFFGFGWGYGFNSLWWPGCDPWWGWGFGCNAYSYYSPYYGNGGYGYGFGPYIPPSQYVTPQYAYSGGERELVQLYLKDGTVYSVTDYWLVDNQLHFTMADETGTRSVEHVINFDDFDLQKTIDVNTRRGFRVVLRNEPLQQYMEHHPDSTPPPAEAPSGPPPQQN